MKKKIVCLGCILFLFLMTGCKDFLSEKSDSRLATPTTLADNQALLDHYNMNNQVNMSSEILSGDIYVSDADYNGVYYEAEKRLYTWQGDRVAPENGNDWMGCYQKINICNNVLHNIKTYGIRDSDNVRGQALVFRASLYLEAAQLWCLVYDKNTAAKELGLPLRLDPDMNIVSVRSTLQQTYDQILRDLHEAVSLLPVNQISVSRPSKVAALGLLARAYLYMGDYEKSLLYGKQALGYYHTLLDFNTLNAEDSYPMKNLNAEVLFPSYMSSSPLLAVTAAKIPLDFFASYAVDDLRRTIFFRKNGMGDIFFKGNYSGAAARTAVLGTDELYLTVAESYAVTGDTVNAMKLLNQLLITRWRKGTFINYTASDPQEALALIRKERRKELIFRGLRWADLKRYNRDGAHITLTRTVEGKIYTLPPNDLRYAVAIPEDVIKLSGMPQNRR
ncbi:RagB/SusD family nutrient uptake outer membrane protein [Elizabethkingia ursingii]|uniref:Carbohydrate-binding protein SusD n=1 Tax=Elizabethkingia ursingii TaxID=1756150 RepID=A0ABX3ND41_9FLAO|nr:RagB/SusD family nutrient uptake outer membrane protein [Elizabethkingia ursingii]OPB94551.1 hypothetical protein BB021_18290 [Elizabethkingia ursingii]